MSYTDFLDIVGGLLSFDGVVITAYMFLAGLIATVLHLQPQSARFFRYCLLGILVFFLGQNFTGIVVEARLPYSFMFSLGVVGLGTAILGLLAVTFSPSIFAFAEHTRRRKLMLALNFPMLFPFGPVILFFFVLRDYRQSIATISGDSVQTVLP
ncbi:MAG TPA: hypothetical protein V6C76_07170 [Drouetiella sp.]